MTYVEWNEHAEANVAKIMAGIPQWEPPEPETWLDLVTRPEIVLPPMMVECLNHVAAAHEIAPPFATEMRVREFALAICAILIAQHGATHEGNFAAIKAQAGLGHLPWKGFDSLPGKNPTQLFDEVLGLLSGGRCS